MRVPPFDAGTSTSVRPRHRTRGTVEQSSFSVPPGWFHVHYYPLPRVLGAPPLATLYTKCVLLAIPFVNTHTSLAADIDHPVSSVLCTELPPRNLLYSNSNNISQSSQLIDGNRE